MKRTLIVLFFALSQLICALSFAQSYSVLLTSVDSNQKLATVKMVKSVSGLGLKESKTIVDSVAVSVPTVVPLSDKSQSGALAAVDSLVSLNATAIAYVGTTTPEDYGTYGDDVYWALCDGVLTISGTGEMTDLSVQTSTQSPWYSKRSSIQQIVVCEGVTTLGDYAFYQSSVTSVSLPSTLTEIHWGAFWSCTQLSDINLPEGLTTIDVRAFSNCSALKTVVLPSTLSTIGNFAFAGISMEEIHFNSQPSIGSSVFSGNTLSSATAFTNSISYSSTLSSYGFANVEIGGVLGDNCYWNFDTTTGTLTISGTGAMPNYQARASQWYSNDEIKEIVIEEGITSIGTYTFAYESNLTTVTLPSTLTSIGNYAFYSSSNIYTINAKSVTTFGTNAFSNYNSTVYASNTEVADAFGQLFYNVKDLSTLFTIYLRVADEGTPLNILEYEWTSVSVYYEEGGWLANSVQTNDASAPLMIQISPDDASSLEGKALTFHLDVSSPSNESPAITDGEYIINPNGVLLNNAVTAVTYTPGGQAGSQSNPITLNYVALQNMTAPTEVNVKVGETVRVNDLFSYTPSNASLPILSFEPGEDDEYVHYEENWEAQGSTFYVTGLSPTTGLSDYSNVFSWFGPDDRSGDISVNVTLDANDCLYYLNIYADGEALDDGGYKCEQDFITVQPYIDGVAYGDPLTVLTYYDNSSNATAAIRYHYYILNVPANVYAGKEIEFHLITDYDEDYLREIDGNTLPMKGEYIVKTILYNNYTTASQVPVTAGTSWGNVQNPVIINYKNLNDVYLVNPEIELAVGQSIDLSEYYAFSPEDASIPVDLSLSWDVSEEYVSVSGNTMTGVAVTPEGGDWGLFNYEGGEGEISGEAEILVTVTDPNMMTVWFEITDEGVAFDNYAEYSYLEVSAFADGDSLGVSTYVPYWTENQQLLNRLKLSFVPSNPAALKGKELTFHLITSAASAFDGSRENATIETDGAYIIHPSCVTLSGQTTKVTYEAGKTWGTPETPVVLDYVNLNTISTTNPIELQVGQTAVLNDYVTYDPTNASIPVDFSISWNSYSTEFFDLGENSSGDQTIEAKQPTSSLGTRLNWYTSKQQYGSSSVVITDPNNCTYFVTITAEGEALNEASWNLSEMNYITVTPYVDGKAVGDPVSVRSFLDMSTQVLNSYYYYVLSIPGTYAGKTVEFHVTTDYDSETLYEIETNSLPMTGEYIIRDVSLTLDDGTSYSASTMPVTKGKEWGTVMNPVVLNYVTPQSISTTPASLTLTEGDTYNLDNVSFTFNPETSSVPVNFSPEWTEGNYVMYVKVEKTNTGTTLTALQATPEQISVEAYSDNYSVSLPVFVEESTVSVSGITIADENKNQVVWLGDVWQDAYLTLDDLYTISPSDATNQEVTWTSSDESVAEINSGGNEFGEWYAIGQKVGNTTLTVKTSDGSFTDTLNLEVRSHVTGIELKKQSVTVNRGSTVTLSTYIKNVLPSDAYEKSVIWAVTDTATVVTISKTSSGVWRMKANRVGTTTIQVTSVDNPQVSAYLTVEVNSKVTGITISDANKNQVVWLGDNWMDAYLPLDDLYEITPKDAVNQDVTWTSSDESVAEINSGGNEFGEWYAVGKKAGTTSLIVKTVDGGKSDTLTLEVRSHVTGIELKKQSVTVNRGSTVTLSTYIKNVLPSDAYDKSVTWAVADTATVVTISKTSSGTWRMKANRVGTTYLVVTSVDNPQVSAYLTVVVESTVTGVTVEEPSQILYIGESVNLNYTIQPSDATNKAVTWTSSDNSVVKITETPNGVASYSAIAQKVGTVTLTVTTADGGKTATINIEVRAHVESIELKSQSVTVKRGSTTNLSNYIQSILPDDAYDKSVTWAVTDTATVVTVAQNLFGVWQMKANRAGTTTIQVTSVDNPQAVAFLTVTVESSVTGITVEEPSQILYIGESVNLNYTIQPSDATNKAVTWTSSDNSVVKMTETPNGVAPYTAVAQKVGTATLTVTTADGGKTATISVEVRAHVESITLTTQSVTVNRGSMTNLSDYIKSILPDNAYDKSVTWAVTDTATVVTVSQSSDIWQMKANRTGTTTLQVTSVDNPRAVAFLTVEVTSTVTGITVEEPSQILYIGESANLRYTIQPSDASNKVVTWTSSDESVVKIESNPNITLAVAQKVGTATLTVTTADGGKTATISVEVRAHVESITLTTQSITVNRGTTTNLSNYIQSVLPANAYDKSVTWTSSNASVVSINGSTAVANAIGACRVTVASVDNPRATASLEIVVEAAAAGIYATNPVQTVWIGEDVDLSYYFVPADATSTIKSWTSSNPSVVAISGGTTTAYRAVAQKSGTAVLTVTTDNGQTATIQVTVHAHVTGIELTAQQITVNRGTTTDLAQYIKAILPTDAYDKSVTWAVTDTATVVTVSQKNDAWQMKANRVGTTTLRVVSVDNPQVAAFLSVIVESVVTGVTVEEPNQILYIGEYANLNYTIQPSDATNKAVTWKSSDESIVKITSTQNGTMAVAQKVGTATLTVTTVDGGKTATIIINTRAHVESITLTTQSITLNRGNTVNLTQYIKSVLPENAYDKSVTWTSGNPDIVSINGSMAVANAIGTCRLTAASVDNPQATAVLEVTVEAAADGINVDNPVQTVWVGDDVDLGYYFVPADATSNIKSWTSSDPSVVAISGDGTTTAYRAVAQKSGTAVLTVTTDNGQTATIQVTVYAHVEAIRLTVRSIRVNRGTTTGLDQYIDVILPEDAYNKSVTWAVTDTATVVSVSQSNNGWQMTANRVGQTTLQVTSVDNPQVQAFLMVTVESVSDEIQAEEPEQTIWIGESVNLGIVFDRPDATTTISSWTSSNPDIVSIRETDTGYRAEGVAAGEATLTVTTDNGLTTTIAVSVHAHVDEMTTDTQEITIQKGETISLDGYLIFQPENAYNKDVEWTSEDEGVVTISGRGAHWTATGIGGGTTTLTAVSVDNPDMVIYINIRVNLVSEGIIVTNPKQTLPVHSEVDLSYTLVPEDATSKVKWSSSDEDVVSILEYDDGSIHAYCNQKGTAVLTATTEDGQSATIEVEVYSVIEAIEQGNSTGIGLVVGESCSLSEYLSDPFIMIFPEDADDKRLAWTDTEDESVAKVTYVDGEYYVTGIAKGETLLKMYAVGNPSVSVNVYIYVVDAVESFKVNNPEQTVMVGEYIDMSYTIMPESASDRYVNWTVNSSEPDICMFSYVYPEGYVCWPTKSGSFYVVGTPDGIHYDSIHVTAIRPELEGIKVEYNGDNIMKGDTLIAKLTAIPENAAIDASKLTYKIPEAEGGWKFVDVTMDVIRDEEIHLIIATHTWGYYTIELNYPGMEGSGDATTGAGKKKIQDIFFNVGQHVELEKGWNWTTLASTNVYQGNVDIVAACFDNKILDARTQKDLLYFDPDYGYFGTLYSLSNDCYKLNVSEDVDYRRTDVTHNALHGYVVQLKKGWNWIEYPYDVDYTFDELRAAGALGNSSYADRIVSKNGGFAQWTGYTWFGDLKELKENEGYMYYTSTDHDLVWPEVTKLDQKLDKASGAPGRRTLVGEERVWQYNHRRFADNMTIVADVKGMAFPDDCSIGAFVGDECRGEGRYVDGHFFITVHGKIGETITFILHDDVSDTYYTIPGTMNFDLMAGSLQHPVPFKVGEKTTDIDWIGKEDDGDADVYDLVGRRVVSPATGFYIKDGKKIFQK